MKNQLEKRTIDTLTEKFNKMACDIDKSIEEMRQIINKQTTKEEKEKNPQTTRLLFYRVMKEKVVSAFRVVCFVNRAGKATTEPHPILKISDGTTESNWLFIYSHSPEQWIRCNEQIISLLKTLVTEDEKVLAELLKEWAEEKLGFSKDKRTVVIIRKTGVHQ